MDSEEHHRLTWKYWKTCFRYAKKRGYPTEECEDFATYAVIKELERGWASGCCAWSFGDYIVNQFGTRGTSKNKAHKVAIDEVTEKQMPPTTIFTDGYDFRILEKVPHSNLIVLSEAYGYLDSEIAEMFGVSYATIWKRKRKAIRTVRKKSAQSYGSKLNGGLHTMVS